METLPSCAPHHEVPALECRSCCDLNALHLVLYKVGSTGFGDTVQIYKTSFGSRFTLPAALQHTSTGRDPVMLCRERKRGLELSVKRTPQQEAEENVILEQAAQIQAARKAEQAQAQRKAPLAPAPQAGVYIEHKQNTHWPFSDVQQVVGLLLTLLECRCLHVLP